MKDIGVELGVGRGFTSGSDPLIVKAIIDYPFPVPSKKSDSDNTQSNTLAMGTSPRTSPTVLIGK